MSEKLLEQVAAPENLLAAWRAVRGNIPKYRRQRASGPDGVSLADFERDLQTQLSALSDMLLKGRYRPAPAAFFAISKKSGGQRMLAILPVRERVAQRAAQQVIEPLWEPEFMPCSFGFRPGCSIEQAVAHVQGLRRKGLGWVVDGDIAACFDSLDHDLLIGRLKHKIGDSRLLALLQAWLDAGVMQAGPPQSLDTAAASRLRSVSSLARRGLNWVLDSVARDISPYPADPYTYGRAVPHHYSDYDEVDEGAAADSHAPGREPHADEMRRGAIRQIAGGGLLLGVNLLRPAAGRALGRAGSALKTVVGAPAGRRLLKKGVMVSGGLAGLAAAAAVTAYVMQRKAGRAPLGVLQGSPLSPLLANIYLHPFDAALIQAGYHLARFADDWVILCRDQDQAERAYNEAVRALARLRLKVNQEKTRILSPQENLEWLGAVIR
ncbi:MAG: RNA-dependent DNA polymerase [Chloroflexi bacterium]|nr:RNA-dependent DNA polymerase [Chloroflexota bacterium]